MVNRRRATFVSPVTLIPRNGSTNSGGLKLWWHRALDRTRRECEEQGKPFEELKLFLVNPRGAGTFAEAAAKLGVSEGALKSTVHRLRKRYGEIFREEVAMTVSDPGEVEDELQWLLSALGG